MKKIWGNLMKLSWWKTAKSLSLAITMNWWKKMQFSNLLWNSANSQNAKWCRTETPLRHFYYNKLYIIWKRYQKRLTLSLKFVRLRTKCPKIHLWNYLHYFIIFLKRQCSKIHFKKNGTFFKRNDIVRNAPLWNNLAC